MNGLSHQITFNLGGRKLRVAAVVASPEEIQIALEAEGFGTGEELWLHWGLSNAKKQWTPPPSALYPPRAETKAVPGAARSLFESREDRHDLALTFVPAVPEDGSATAPVMPAGLYFVLFKPPNQWIKQGNGNFFIDFPHLVSEVSRGSALKKTTKDLLAVRDKATVHQSWRVEHPIPAGIELLLFEGEEGADLFVLTDAPKSLLLHWGMANQKGQWRKPQLDTIDSRPFKTAAWDEKAVQTEFMPVDVDASASGLRVTDGAASSAIQGTHLWLPGVSVAPYLLFVLKEKAGNVWLKHGNDDFDVHIPIRESWKAAIQEYEEKLKKAEEEKEMMRKKRLSDYHASRDARRVNADIFFKQWSITGGLGELDCSAESTQDKQAVKVTIVGCLEIGCLLHWGILEGKRKSQWTCPPESCRPPGTAVVDPKNASGADGWKGEHREVVEKILGGEVDAGGWTLMHRYNLCRGIIEDWDGDRPEEEKKSLTRVKSWATVFQEEPRKPITATASFSSLVLPPLSRESSDKEFWSWIYVWQRFSFMKILDWQRNYNTKPRELAGATNSLSYKIAEVWKTTPKCRPLIRLVIGTLGRGGSQGQRIRDEILHIMHRNGIPETAGHFYEQWHQKLHNNTTPDDVGICKALLAFLRSGGNMQSYWDVLNDHGITRERLASYDRPINKEPYMHGDTGKLIFEFDQYLKILQSVHDATDLATALDYARGKLPHDVVGQLERAIHEVGHGGLRRRRSKSFDHGDMGGLDSAHHKFMRVAECRDALLRIINDKNVDPGALVDILFLDLALEQQQNIIIQSTYGEKRVVQLTDQLGSLLMSLSGHAPENGELRAIYGDFVQLARKTASLNWQNGAVECALLLKGLCDRAARSVGDVVDEFQNLLGPKAKFLGSQVGTDPQVLEVFVDEVVRGSVLFSVSLVLKRIEPELRAIAHLPPWQMISVVDRIQGELKKIDRLMHIQDKVYERPTIFLCGAVSGEEEVPAGVHGVLVRSAAESPDILSHVSVRARNAGVLLAVSFDADLTQQIEGDFLGKWIEIRAKKDGSGLTITEVPRPDDLDKQSKKAAMRGLSRQESRLLIEDSALKGRRASQAEMNLTQRSNRWVVAPSEFDRSVVGSKSLNLQILAKTLMETSSQLPFEIRTPEAVALPYGTMQKTLMHPLNENTVLPRLKSLLSQLKPDTSNDRAAGIFGSAKHFIEELVEPDEYLSALKETMQAAARGKGQDECRLLDLLKDEDAAWEAVKAVWASLFGIRPWVSLSKAGRKYHELNMAVLIQELLPASYAFVLHTQNPFSDEKDEVYGEVVPGLGETLVGNYPGRALSFRVKKGEKPQIVSFLSKSVALRPTACLIFRSDSNGEDLEGFAGAGLFESVTAERSKEVRLRYHRLRIVQDSAYRERLLTKLGQAGFEIEKAMKGVPQDVEGCVVNEEDVFIVQTRPQV
ncbi:unnamed protein product [Vitrella brassicaformis CCMP3155]|uniref:Uncharacterized protein n=1 Tax=Vitrella brassicaformis (strain CCMP3155) TaxID=1169540 RepID=A0A0G4F4E4_VITBC|nr:unnamed protein product [Vitrella brassicaformis CCMP3155]|eukprot:CEM06669.1 unnamed protein product [Vitrella brassicaformis CCMP3155]